MAYARSEVYNPEEVGVYHCVSRCVRRAFLCGKDTVTKISYEHRREWIRERLKSLVDIFAIDVIAYAVMNNHLHCLIRNRPDIAEKWSDREVAKRWRMLFPFRRVNGVAEAPNQKEIDAICSNKKLVKLYRQRLSDISWFNRCMNENIARRANAEDRCKGRFWEGRFHCQRVFDIGAILACSAYIDLNPIRAGISKTLESSDYTSIQERILMLKKGKIGKGIGKALTSIEEISEKTLTTQEYLELVDGTGRQMRDGKASISKDLEPILKRLKLEPKEWLSTTQKLRIKFRRVVGPVEKLEQAARRAGKNWFHGLKTARAVFVN